MVDPGRRQTLAAVAAILTGTAGCNSGSNSSDTPTTTTSTTSTVERTTSTTEETTTTEDTTTTTEGPEPGSFEAIYQNTFSEEHQVLPEEDIKHLEGLEFPEQLRKGKQILHERQEYSSINPEDWQKLTRNERYLLHQQLDYDLDEAQTHLRKGGGGEPYTVAFHNQDGNWKKHIGGVGLAADSLLPHGETPETVKGGPSSQSQQLAALWDQENLGTGAATAIETYRQGVKEAETFKESAVERGQHGNWLTLMQPLDSYNDHQVVSPEWTNEWDFGNVGYSREVATELAEIADWDANQQFNTEVEFGESLTEAYHNNKIGEQDDKFLHVDITDGELEKGQEKLVDANNRTIYAEVDGLEQHKADTYEIAIPDEFWPEHQYPGDVEAQPAPE